MKVLGIDPGSQVTGFGLVQVNKDGPMTHLSHGIIAPPSSLDFHDRLGVISREIEALIDRMKPDIVVVERIFLGKRRLGLQARPRARDRGGGSDSGRLHLCGVRRTSGQKRRHRQRRVFERTSSVDFVCGLGTEEVGFKTRCERCFGARVLSREKLGCFGPRSFKSTC